MTYDPLGRRIAKDIDNSADWDATYHYYHDGQSMIETRNASGQVLTQHVWGTRYIDELVQVAVNDDPADGQEDDCETTYYGLQDANYNVLGLAESDGDLCERYEYTPYGQRTVYTDAGANDTLISAPILHSRPVQVGSADQSYALCDFGHQGLMHDKEFGLIYNRARYRDATLGRSRSRDPAGYADGLNQYESLRSSPLSRVDPDGTVVVSIYGIYMEPETLRRLNDRIRVAILAELASLSDLTPKPALTDFLSKNFGNTESKSERDLEAEFKLFSQRKEKNPCSLEQFVAVGHSDGATAIYRLKSLFHELKPSPAYLGFVDLVRINWSNLDKVAHALGFQTNPRTGINTAALSAQVHFSQ